MIKRYIFIVLSFVIALMALLSTKVQAADLVAYAESKDVFQTTISSIEIYSNGKVTVKYKYGLRRLDMFYCEKGDMCNNGNYYMAVILESDAENSYKHSGEGMATYSFNVGLNSEKTYGVRIEGYFGTSSAYSGVESIQGSFTVNAVPLVADTGLKYVQPTSSGSGDIEDGRLSGLMDNVVWIVNTIILPVIFVLTSLLLVIKGTILGVQIVKSAENPEVRREKIRALTWLFVGVGLGYAATTLVGLVTGFFTDVLNL